MEWNDAIEDPKKEKLRLEQIIKEDPNDAEAHYELATVYENIHDDAKAIEYCEKAIALDPDKALYLAFLIFLTISFDAQKAFDALARFIDLGPDEGDYYTERVIDELGCIDEEFALEYIANLRTQGKEEIAHTMERWIWNP
jgi:tetratricopeptide (TPR) repeat protein